MTIVVASLLVFVGAFFLLGVGVLLGRAPLKGSCGGVAGDGDDGECGVCTRKEAALCPSEQPLVQIAQVTHPNPKHHRS